MARRFFVNGLIISSILMAAGAQAQTDLPFEVESITSFDEPWALAFLPDGRMLVTEKKGNLFIVTQNGEKSPDIDGVPDVAYGGQGGLGDIAMHPDFIENNVIYLSYAESGVGGHARGAAVVRAVLNQTEGGGELSDVEVIWRQYPKVVASAITGTGCCSTTGVPVDLVRRTPEIHAGPGHADEPGQDPAIA